MKVPPSGRSFQSLRPSSNPLLRRVLVVTAGGGLSHLVGIGKTREHEIWVDADGVVEEEAYKRDVDCV